MRKVLVFLITVFSPIWVMSQEVPTRSEVGASQLPDKIAPIVAPFDMPQLSRPEFPDRALNIIRRGAKPGKLSTSAIQKAIDELSSKGGGTVIVPAGNWLTGRIMLRSNINLHLEEDAELCFSGEIKDYLPVVFTRNEGIEMYSLGALVYADGVSNIAITGKGKLIGPGNKCEIFREHKVTDAVEDFVSDKVPVAERIYDGKEGRALFLPMFFAPVRSTNILVEGVTFENSVFWNIVPQYCENIIIRGITVNSVGHGRTDGIDIESSRNALIEYCTLNCGDDCFTIKSGRGEDGLRANKPSENIVIRHSLSLHGAGAVTCGSETAGMIRNMYVHDCVFEGTHNGILFKTRRPRGGGGETLHYERIRLNIPGPAFKWDMLGMNKWVGELANRMPARPVNNLTPAYRNIVFKDIVVENCRQLIDLIGIPESPVTGVLMDNVEAKCQKLVNLQDVNGFVITNSTIHSECDSVTVTDGRNIMFVNTRFHTPGSDVSYTYSGELARPVIRIASPGDRQGNFYPVRERLQVQSLNGTWKFKIIEGISLPEELSGWNTPGYNASGWGDILVPGNWETQGYKTPEYGDQLGEYTGLYSRKFNYDPAWTGKHVILRFDGVHFGYECYINGHKAGQWGSAFNLCQFDITPYLHADKENLICVKVATRSMGWEFDRNDCWSLTGISRDVELFALDNVYLEDVKYTSEVDTQLDAAIRVRVGIGRFAKDNKAYAIHVALSDPLNHHVLSFNAPIHEADKTYEFTGNLKQPKLWTAETPNLYRMEVCITDRQGNVVQRINEKVGVRSVATEGTSLQVNHRSIRLHGVCLNEIDPKVGRALSYKERRRQLELMKAANINFIRTAHYPFGPEFLALCDEMGFYVCCEVPFGHGDDNLTKPDFLPELLARAEATLRRDKNHPSVIIWSLGNENPYTDIVEEVIKFVKQTDPTRPRGLPQAGGYFLQNRQAMSEHVDIYMPHYLAIDRLNEAVKDTRKPVLLTEYAHSHGLSFGELEDQYANIIAHPAIIGGSIWCWSDQAILTYKRNVFDKQREGHYQRATGNAQQGVWMDSVRYMDSNDYAGTDGIVYADGYPQEDYFVVRKVYSPVVITADTLKGHPGQKNTFTVNIENRFDFISLHGYRLHWQIRNVYNVLDKGDIWLQTHARSSRDETIHSELPGHIPCHDLMLCLEVVDISGKSIYEKNLPVNLVGSEKDYLSIIHSIPQKEVFKTKVVKDGMHVTAGSVHYSLSDKGILQIADKAGKNMISSPLYLRAGRLVTTNLQYRGRRESSNWEPYLLTPVIESLKTYRLKEQVRVELKCKWNRIEKPEEFISGSVTINVHPNGIIRFDYDLQPSENATGKLLECGLTLQLDSAFDVFRWIGAGPFSHTPGKTMHNERNSWALHRNDIRFIGNKGCVDIGVVTDGTRGLGCWSGNGNIGVENIEGKIHLSQNAIITGYGAKFTQPNGILPINEVTRIAGSLILFVDQPTDTVPFMKPLFNAYQLVVPEQPFYKSYGW